MPLKPVPEMMQDARRGRYAVGYFESWNLESLQGVIDAAEGTRSPVIIGFNGEFLARPGRQAEERLSWYAALGKAAAETASVPCGSILNECPQDDWVKRACECGFNLVMPVPPSSDDGEYIQRVAEITRFAHERGVSVEGEIGELPCGASGSVESGGVLTDPEYAERFVVATGIDLLAVSVGNVHILVKGEKYLDLERLEAIRKRVDVPLVLHGGTGVATSALAEAIKIGVTKVNYGTYLKQRYLRVMRRALDSDNPNPHELLGMGGGQDVLVAVRHAVRDAVLERIDFLGCCGKAR